MVEKQKKEDFTKTLDDQKTLNLAFLIKITRSLQGAVG